jgi:hypothetical protein
MNPDGTKNEEPYLGGVAELVEAMRVAATPEGGRPAPEYVGYLVKQVLGIGAKVGPGVADLKTRPPAVE